MRRCSPVFSGRNGLAHLLLSGQVGIQDARRKLKNYDCERERGCTKDRLNPTLCAGDKCDVWTLRNMLLEHTKELEGIGRSGRKGLYGEPWLKKAQEQTEEAERRKLDLGFRSITYN
jgi:hypothetical protein